MPTSDPDVPPLEILFGCRPWTYASEAGSRASCGICDASASGMGRAVCMGCLVTGLDFDRRLKYRRQDAEAEERRARKATPTFKGKGVPVSTLTVKEQRSVVKAYRRTAEGRAWLKSQGLLA